jgi:hypothetical protein
MDDCVRMEHVDAVGWRGGASQRRERFDNGNERFEENYPVL